MGASLGNWGQASGAVWFDGIRLYEGDLTQDFSYDWFHHFPTHRVDPLGNSAAATYDLVGNKLTQTDALGQSTTYAYDRFNRLVKIKIGATRYFSVRNTEWQRYVVTMKPPGTGASYAKIAAITYGPYDGYFDNIQFEKSNTARGYNYLENSSFERGSARWSASDNYATAELDAGAYSGSYDAQISLPLIARSYLEAQGAIPVTDTSQYFTVTGFITTAGVSSSGGGAWLHVYFYDAAGSSINDYHTKAVTGNTPWTKYVMAFKPPANTASMRVRAEVYNASGAAKFDNIRLISRMGPEAPYPIPSLTIICL